MKRLAAAGLVMLGLVVAQVAGYGPTGATLLTFTLATLAFVAAKRTRGFRNVTPKALGACYAVAILLTASLAVPPAEAASGTSAGKWYDPRSWGETTWRGIGTGATLLTACGVAVLTLGAGTPVCLGAAALTAGSNVAWDVGAACITGKCSNSEAGQAWTSLSQGNIHDGINHVLSTTAPSAGNAVAKVHDGQKLGALDYVGLVADSVPVTKAGKVFDLAAHAGSARTFEIAASKAGEVAKSVRVASDPAKYARESLSLSQSAVRAADAGRIEVAASLVKKAQEAASKSSTAVRALREADPTVLERVAQKFPKAAQAEKAAKRLEAAEKSVAQANKAAKQAGKVLKAGEASRIAKAVEKDAKAAEKIAKASKADEAIQIAKEAVKDAGQRSSKAASRMSREAEEVSKIVKDSKPSLKAAVAPPFSRTAHWIKGTVSLDHGVARPDCSDLACLPAPSSDPNSPWMDLMHKRAAFCQGNRDAEFSGWDARICDSDVTSLLHCLMNSLYENPFTDPACLAQSGPWVYDALCVASDFEFCPEQTTTTSGDGQPSSGPWGSVDACAEVLPRNLCEWVLVEGGDPAKALLDLFYESMRPVVNLNQAPQHTGASNGGEAYLVPVVVNHGGEGLSCQDGDAAAWAKALGYCYEDYVIQGVSVGVNYNGELVNSLQANRQELAEQELLDPASEQVSFKLPVVLPEHDTGLLNAQVTVNYQLIRAYSDGRPPILDPPSDGGAPRYYSVTESKQWSINTDDSGGSGSGGGTGSGGGGSCGSGGGSGGGGLPIPDPDPQPCTGTQCGGYWDDNLGGAGLSALLNWKVALVLVSGAAAVFVYRSGQLYRWTNGTMGRKPRSPLDLYRKPNLFERLKARLTGRPPPRKLKPGFEANGVPVIVPPNADGTGPDSKALRDLLEEGP